MLTKKKEIIIDIAIKTDELMIISKQTKMSKFLQEDSAKQKCVNWYWRLENSPRAFSFL